MSDTDAQTVQLANQLDRYLARTLATSSDEHNTSRDQEIKGSKVRPLLSVLKTGGITLAAEMSDVNWTSFCSRVTTPFDNSSTESLGIHPTVREIFSLANLLCGDAYQLKFEDPDHLLNRPDISIMLKLSFGTATETVVLPVKIRFDDFDSALQKAMGCLASNLRNLLEMHGPNVVLSGFAIGTDGRSIAVGHASIKDYCVTVRTTGKEEITLWDPSTISHSPRTHPRRETLGVRVIRSFLLSSPAALGHTALKPAALATPVCTYQLLEVLGRGAFSTVFRARADATGQAQTTVVIKREGLDSTNAYEAPLVLLQHECAILRAFSSLTPLCAHLPSLHDVQWAVTPANPYVPIVPVGVPLDLWCAGLTPASRNRHAEVLFIHVCDGLRAAHNLGWCHRDVVYVEVSGAYVVIDWGLAAAPGELMHENEGGLPYFHDDIVAAVNRERLIPFQPEHDFASARYVAWAFKEGSKFSVTWANHAGDTVHVRTRMVGNCLQDVV